MTENTIDLLACFKNNDKCNYVLMILNQPLRPDYEVLKKLWSNAKFKVAVDGGTNELYECTGPDRDKFLPDLISGDFDSLKQEVSDFYESKLYLRAHQPTEVGGAERKVFRPLIVKNKVEMIKTQDQNYTDFTKALKCVTEKTKQLKIDHIVVLGAFGGRMDQVFANVDSLFQARTLTEAQVVLVSHCQLAILLGKGKHKLLNTGIEGEWCGLIPIGCPASQVTTSGLKWNLDNQSMEFGQLISTSNTFDGSGNGCVSIETSHELLWVMELKI